MISADSIDGVNDKSVSASGDVVMTEGTMTLNAERLDYDKASDTALSPGKVRLNRDGDVVTGVNLKLKVETEIGTLDDPTFLF